MKRKIINIDEKKCNGCGACASGCPEGAIQIIAGKARLVNEIFCDGLGACIGTCPQGAITIEEREVGDYQEKKAMANIKGKKQIPAAGSSQLQNWPIQLKLISPLAPYFNHAELIICADCVPFAYADFHNRFLKSKILINLCPKLDQDPQAYVEKLTRIFKHNNIKSVTLVHMEVPCCFGLVNIVKEAIKNSGKNITVKEHIVSIKGDVV